MADFPWYRNTPDAAAIAPHVAECAVEWLMELQCGEVAPQRVEEWRGWRAAHPDHERAWRRIESVRGKLTAVSSPLGNALARATLTQPDSTQRRRVVRALTVLVSAGAAAWSAGEYMPVREWAADYRTGMGERSTVVLTDGTRVLLNTDTALDVRFSQTERRVKLIAGEILLTTHEDARTPSRPFLVETAQGTARALGTEYSVRQEGARTAIGVFKGAVEIRPRRNADRRYVLKAGYRASYTAQDVMEAGAAIDDQIAWKEGFIVARSMQLGDFIAELGRYSREPLSCDPSVAARRVSGSFPLADTHKVLEALSVTLDLKIELVTRFWGAKGYRIVPGNVSNNVSAPRVARS
jgi:transmembrane sensor